MEIKRLLYAPSIHQGGGKTLLTSLINGLEGDNNDVLFVLDIRLGLPSKALRGKQVFWVKPTVTSRLWLELKLSQFISKDTLVLCMGNLPPLFVKCGIQRVFVQNRYLVENISLSSFSFKSRVRITFERWWLRTRATGVGSFIVQTPTMQRLIKDAFGAEARILPFLSVNMQGGLFPSGESQQKKYNFVYIASGEGHKNHKTLIYAWIALAKESIFPSLCLTLDEKQFPVLCRWIMLQIKSYGLKVSLIGECSHDKIYEIYRQSEALIYPSLFESFGLPLIEAAMLGLPVAASDKPYVTDVITPSAVFDPNSIQDIVNTVRYFNYAPSFVSVELLEAKQFLEYTFIQ